MIEFVTVWVLTVGYFETDYQKGGPSTYQLQYATQSVCEKQKRSHDITNKPFKKRYWSRCDFQQIPVYKQVK